MVESAALRSMGIECGDNCLIDDSVIILHPHKLTLGHRVRIDAFSVLSGEINIGNNSHISTHCNLMAGREVIYLGENCNMAKGSSIYAESDDLSGRGLIGPCVSESVRHIHRGIAEMSNYSCLGLYSAMMPNSVLGWGSVLCAYSILIGKAEPESLYQGTPAKRVRDKLPNWKAHLRAFQPPGKLSPLGWPLCGGSDGHDS